MPLKDTNVHMTKVTQMLLAFIKDVSSQLPFKHSHVWRLTNRWEYANNVLVDILFHRANVCKIIVRLVNINTMEFAIHYQQIVFNSIQF
jgi:hypothetical protein